MATMTTSKTEPGRVVPHAFSGWPRTARELAREGILAPAR